jgi:uncharacterized alkaline shock family protein YloU
MTSTATEKDATAATARVTGAGSPASRVTPRDASAVARGGEGQTKIADVVVQKIASLSAREVPGVHDLGGGTSRTIGALRGRIPGAGTSQGQGVTVEVGERQVAVDLDVLVDYGVAIPDLARTLRQNVVGAIEEMTGLDVVEVNITVVDVWLGDNNSDGEPQRARVE